MYDIHIFHSSERSRRPCRRRWCLKPSRSTIPTHALGVDKKSKSRFCSAYIPSVSRACRVKASGGDEFAGRFWANHIATADVPPPVFPSAVRYRRTPRPTKELICKQLICRDRDRFDDLFARTPHATHQISSLPACPFFGTYITLREVLFRVGLKYICEEYDFCPRGCHLSLRVFRA